jgi:hypothetical protein
MACSWDIYILTRLHICSYTFCKALCNSWILLFGWPTQCWNPRLWKKASEKQWACANDSKPLCMIAMKIAEVKLTMQWMLSPCPNCVHCNGCQRGWFFLVVFSPSLNHCAFGSLCTWIKHGRRLIEQTATRIRNQWWYGINTFFSWHCSCWAQLKNTGISEPRILGSIQYITNSNYSKAKPIIKYSKKCIVLAIPKSYITN